MNNNVDEELNNFKKKYFLFTLLMLMLGLYAFVGYRYGSELNLNRNQVEFLVVSTEMFWGIGFGLITMMLFFHGFQLAFWIYWKMKKETRSNRGTS